MRINTCEDVKLETFSGLQKSAQGDKKTQSKCEPIDKPEMLVLDQGDGLEPWTKHKSGKKVTDNTKTTAGPY